MVFFEVLNIYHQSAEKFKLKAALRFSFISLKMAKAKQGNDKKDTGEILGKKNHHTLFMGV